MNDFDFMEPSKLKLAKGDDINEIKKKAISKLPWIEKYRPKKIEDIVSQEKIVSMLKNELNNHNLPHMLFYGPPGTGKTSTILAIGRELFGPEMMKSRIIELNASDDRGINAVRNKIKIFARNAINKYNPNKEYPCPPYKIIILDEADSMTTDAQSALRKIMEDYSQITRFCFICNYISKIIEPISSRCSKFKFAALNKDTMINKLQTIANSENINNTPELLQTVVDLSKGDMRKAIMMLQNIKYQQSFLKRNINCDDVIEINGYISNTEMKSLINIIKTGTFQQIINEAKEIVSNGHPIDYFLERFYNYILNDTDILDKHKSKISIHFSDNQQKLIEGADEYLHLLDILTYCYMVLQNKF